MKVFHKAANLLWALILLHDSLGISPFFVKAKAPAVTLGQQVVDDLAGPHWWVALLHLTIANGIILYLARPKFIRACKISLLASVGFFTTLSVALLILTIQNSVYLLTSAFCFSLTIISWRAYLDTKVSIVAEEILRAAARLLTEEKRGR